MHYLYILYSKSTVRFYVWQSSDVLSRLDLHNTHHFKGAFTKIASDWEIAMAFPCTQKKDALFLERFVKRMKKNGRASCRESVQKILTAILANQKAVAGSRDASGMEAPPQSNNPCKHYVYWGFYIFCMNALSIYPLF